MPSQFLAVRLGLLSLVTSHLPEIAMRCPTLHTAPTPRIDQIPQALMQQMDWELKQIEEQEASLPGKAFKVLLLQQKPSEAKACMIGPVKQELI